MFYKKPFFKESLYLSILIAILHYISLELYLYWTISWFDILMHFLGGFLIAIFVILVLYSYSDFESLKKHKIFLFSLIVGMTLVVGLGWELWEIFVGFTDAINDLGDTILDIVMDVIGAFSAIYYSKNKLWEKK
ncbi:hypothetical protein GW764_01270 [Candidatus Parcubacteria bacterium]|nr:hypothetical protein [Candidatus Parcubacteria bacterium]